MTRCAWNQSRIFKSLVVLFYFVYQLRFTLFVIASHRVSCSICMLEDRIGIAGHQELTKKTLEGYVVGCASD